MTDLVKMVHQEVYYIECASTLERWSRNTWATTSSIPDLYVSERNAKAQIEHGKAGRYLTKYHVPVIKKARLSYE